MRSAQAHTKKAEALCGLQPSHTRQATAAGASAAREARLRRHCGTALGRLAVHTQHAREPCCPWALGHANGKCQALCADLASAARTALWQGPLCRAVTASMTVMMAQAVLDGSPLLFSLAASSCCHARGHIVARPPSHAPATAVRPWRRAPPTCGLGFLPGPLPGPFAFPDFFFGFAIGCCLACLAF